MEYYDVAMTAITNTFVSIQLKVYLCDSKCVEKALWRFQSKESGSGKDEAEWDHTNLEWKKTSKTKNCHVLVF